MKIEVKWNSRLSEIERKLAIPLIEMAQQLTESLYHRIQRGIASDGMFSPMGARSKPTPSRGLFWVSPDREQPPGYVIKVTTGSYLAGWAGYDSYLDYCKALGQPPRDFFDTGELMRSLKARVMGPGRVKVTFYGTHKIRKQPKAAKAGDAKRVNREIAWLASKDEREPMLMPTRGEMDELQKLLVEHFDTIAQGAAAQGLRKRKPATPRRR